MSGPPLPLAAIRQPAFLYDAAGTIVEANDRAEAIAGRPLVGCSAAAVIRIFGHCHSDGTPLAPAELPAVRALAGSEMVDMQFAITTADGRTMHILGTASPIRDGCAVTGALVIWQDVTGLVAAEEALRQRVERFRVLVNLPTDMTLLLDRHGTILHINDTYAAVLGQSPRDLVGRSVWEAMPADVVPDRREYFDRTVESKQTVRFETSRHGRWYDSIVEPVLSDEGEVVQVAIIARDITERRAAERALADQHELLERLIETVPVMISIHDPALGRFHLNRAVEEILGYTDEDAADGRLLERTYPDPAYRATVEAYMRSLEPGWRDMTATARDGSAVPTSWANFRLSNEVEVGVGIDLRERTAMEAALRESEERLRLARDCAGIGVWDWIPSGEADAPTYLRVYDDTIVDPRTLDWRSAVHPDDLPQVESALEAALSLGEPLELGFRYDLGTGEYGWMRVLGAGVYDGAGRLVRVLGVNLDVTAEKEAEAALRESERRHAFLLALGDRLREQADAREVLFVASELLGLHLGANGVIYGEVDAAGEVANVRAGWTDGTVPLVLGATRLDALGMGDRYRQGLVRRIGDVDCELAASEAAVHRALGIRASLGVPVLRGGRLAAVLEVHSGRPRSWTDVEVELVREACDRIWAAMARVRAEEALRKRERTLDGVFRTAPVGIGMASTRIITLVNDQLCRMTGYSREELVGQDARILYPNDEAYDSVGRVWYGQSQVAGIGAVETQWRRKDGSVLDVLLSTSPIDPVAPRENVVFSALDITRLRESEQALESYMDDLQRSNEELQRFAYVASHDLQEPLRSIVSFSQLLERRYKGKLEADADEYIEFIIQGGMRMQRLIEDLLQLSRVETKAKPLVPTDAGEVVADALRLLETPIREAGATVCVGEMPTVLADAAQLEQVFVNLIGNALKYRRADVPAEVRITAKQEGRFWRFAVSDNGIGIEAEYFDRIFVIFQRLHTREEYEGTGIGLAVVRKIVERHGGRIGVESSPGEGSTFVFTLPAA